MSAFLARADAGRSLGLYYVASVDRPDVPLSGTFDSSGEAAGTLAWLQRRDPRVVLIARHVQYLRCG